MSKVTKSPKRWSEAMARRMLAEVAKAGQSYRAFARERGIDPQRLSWWARRLGNESVKRKRSSSKEHRFVELVPRPSTACTIEIELANGRHVIVPSTIDAVVLARVLEVVEGRRC